MDQACDSLRQVAAGLQQCLEEEAPREKKYVLLLKGLACIAELKNQNQRLCEETERMQTSTAEAKAQYDAAELSLQNLLYEKGHYLKEIRACRSFKSKYSDEEIGLISEEEFMRSAPEQFKEGCEDPHKRMLQRLEHEKWMRIEAMKAVDAENSRRDALVAKAAQQRANIAQLEEQLAAVRTIAEPLRARLDIPPMQQHFQQLQSLDQLPQPLHTAFLQLRAAQEAFGLPADIAISGDPAEADAMHKSDGAQPMDEDAAEATPAGDLDMEPGEQPVPKKQKVSGRTDPSAKKAHPMSVLITAKTEPPRTIRLQWLTALQLVTAASTNTAERDYLAQLFPGDDGLFVPSEVAHAAAGGHLTWDAERLDRPYRWAQDIAGMRTVPPLEEANNPKDQARASTDGGAAAVRRMAQASVVLEKLCGCA